MDIEELNGIVDEFATYLRNEIGRAPATQRGYSKAVRQFLASARARPASHFLEPHWKLAHIDKRSVEAYLEHYKRERGWKRATVAHHLTALRGFFGFLLPKGYVERNPLKGLRLAGRARGTALPEGEEAAVHLMFERSAGNLADARLLLLLELIYGAGLRPAQVYGLLGLSLGPEPNTVRIHHGGGRSEVFLSAAGVARVDDYLARRAAALERSEIRGSGDESPTGGDAVDAQPRGDAPLWFDLRVGTGSRLRPKSPAALGRQVRQAMEAVGLDGGAEALRSLAARHFRVRGADVRSLQTFLGAKRLGELDRYRTVGYREVAEAFHRAHPRDKEP